jgi:hypothetical protein
MQRARIFMRHSRGASALLRDGLEVRGAPRDGLEASDLVKRYRFWTSSRI